MGKRSRTLADKLDSIPLKTDELAAAVSKLRSVANPVLAEAMKDLAERNKPESRCRAQQLIGLAVVTGLLSPEQGVGIIERAFSDPDSEVKRWARKAVELIRNRGNEESKNVFLRFKLDSAGGVESPTLLLKGISTERNPRVIAATVRKLGKFNEVKILSKIASFLGHPEGEVRAAAVEALGSMSDNEAFRNLIPMARDRDSKVRAALFRVMRTFNHSVVLTLLSRALDGREIHHALCAVDLLSEDGSERALEILEARSLKHNPLKLDFAVLSTLFRRRGIAGYLSSQGIKAFLNNRILFYSGSLTILIMLTAGAYTAYNSMKNTESQDGRTIRTARKISEKNNKTVTFKAPEMNAKLAVRVEEAARSLGARIPRSSRRPAPSYLPAPVIHPYPLMMELFAKVDALVAEGYLDEAKAILRDFIESGAGGYGPEAMMECYTKLASLYSMAGDYSAVEEVYRYMADTFEDNADDEIRTQSMIDHVNNILSDDSVISSSEARKAIRSILVSAAPDGDLEDRGSAYRQALLSGDMEMADEAVNSIVNSLGQGTEIPQPDDMDIGFDGEMLEAVDQFYNVIEEEDLP